MNTYPEAASAIIQILHKDAAGATITPTLISYSLYNELDVLVTGPIVPSIGGGAYTAVTISALNNTLAAGQINGARLIKATITHAAGVVISNTYYLLQSDITLKVPVNSFLTMTGAMALSLSIGNVTNFTDATETERNIAMMEAYLSIAALSFNVDVGGDTQAIITWPGESATTSGLTAANFAAMTSAVYYALPLRFRTALSNAQVAEANAILVEDPIEDKRRQGLLAETIGESSMMFKTMRPIDRGINRRTHQYLAEFLSSRVRIGRA